MIEDSGRRNIGDRRDAHADEGGRGGETFRAQERFEERVFIFAIAVLVGENLGGGVGLIAADAEVDANITRVRGYELINGAHLVFGRFGVFGEFGGAGTESVVRLRLSESEAAIPVPHLSPAMERRPGD